MAILKLELGDFDEIDYYLIAIHTSLEDYRLAFLINKMLSINLAKSKNEIQVLIKEGESSFSKFNYKNKEKAASWNLIQNKNQVVDNKKDDKQNLFSNITLETATKVYLLPEFKKVDYFLKIENNLEAIKVQEIQNLLNTIESVSTAYLVETHQIKSKNNLIF
jgi:hypothetical protein